MADKKKDRRGLGRGLSALMADVPLESTDTADASAAKPDHMVPIEHLHPNPDQPRRDFNAADLESLAASIRSKGVIQPLIVRRMSAGEGFQIVAGERRWRAAQMAQVHTLPVIERDLDDVEVLEIAIIENIQRADLNPIEEALGYRQLMDRFGRTQEQMAEALGKSRSQIANLLRLLGLPEDVQGLVREGLLSAGHARALVPLENASQVAQRVVQGGLSVRDTERLAKQQTGGPAATAKPTVMGPREKDADTRALEGDLSAALAMAVSIDHEPGTEEGRISIRYKSLEQLDDLCQRLSQG